MYSRVVSSLLQSSKVTSGARRKALFVDAAGTLISPSLPVQKVYQEVSRKYGLELTEERILKKFKEAFASSPRSKEYPKLTYVGDGREFWRHVVFKATGCDYEELFEELYTYYEQPDAWIVAEGAFGALRRLKENSIKLAVVSNFDTRLRNTLSRLGLGEIFDEIIISAEVKIEKPDPGIFLKALEAVKCEPADVVHVGDHPTNDVWGAQQVGIEAWLWGSDVCSFEQMADRILS